MILLAILSCLAVFNTGGCAASWLFTVAFLGFGLGCLRTPVALVYFGVLKFMSEDHQIPLGKFISMLAGLGTDLQLVACYIGQHCCWRSYWRTWRSSRQVGRRGSTQCHRYYSSQSDVFCVRRLAFFFAFGISPKVILRLIDMIRPAKNDDTDLSELKSRAGEGFKMKRGSSCRASSSRSGCPIRKSKEYGSKVNSNRGTQCINGC